MIIINFQMQKWILPLIILSKLGKNTKLDINEICSFINSLPNPQSSPKTKDPFIQYVKQQMKGYPIKIDVSQQISDKEQQYQRQLQKRKDYQLAKLFLTLKDNLAYLQIQSTRQIMLRMSNKEFKEHQDILLVVGQAIKINMEKDSNQKCDFAIEQAKLFLQQFKAINSRLINQIL